jgi:signal transduction histidine kinase
MTLRLLRKHRSEADAQHLRDQADEILNEATELTRMLSSDLSPPVLYSGDTQDILHWLAIRVQEQNDLNVEVDVRDGIRLPNRNLRVLLYQALREVLANVARHSGVQHARLSAWEEGGEVVVEIEDGGRGFDVTTLDKPAHQEGRFGLANIRERLVLVGGHFEIVSDPGEGTRVRLSLPTQGAEEDSEEDA